MGRTLQITCGIVLAVGLLGATQASDNGQENQTSADSRETSATENVQVAADLGRIASALEAQNANDDPEREQRDLNAQEGMAQWAKWMFWAATAQVLLSAVGIGLIYVTFQQTRRAADAADLMVKESAAATKAAQAAVEVTRLSAEAAKEAAMVSTATQRPWVKASIEVSQVVLEVQEGAHVRIESKVVLENVGQSPAILDRWAECRALLCKDPLWAPSQHITGLK